MKRYIYHILWNVRESSRPERLIPSICRFMMVFCIVACLFNPWQIFTALLFYIVGKMMESY